MATRLWVPPERANSVHAMVDTRRATSPRTSPSFATVLRASRDVNVKIVLMDILEPQRRYGVVTKRRPYFT